MRSSYLMSSKLEGDNLKAQDDTFSPKYMDYDISVFRILQSYSLSVVPSIYEDSRIHTNFCHHKLNR